MSFELIQGSQPLLISMPHNGQAIPDDVAATMKPFALKAEDTDWYIDKLYDFAQSLGAWLIMPKYSRYVIDLNRRPDNENLYPGANSTELCPSSSFALQPLYQNEQPVEQQEVERRLSLYWQPYHQALQQALADIKQQHGCAVLLEAHSILSEVPRFFEGKLPDFNLGTADGNSCSAELAQRLVALDVAPYSKVINGRFKGGYITRAYGNPAQQIEAVQLELSQATYMQEPTDQYAEQKAAQVKPKLQQLVQELINYAQTKSAQ